MTSVPDKKAFPEVNVDKELNPGHDKRVEPDATSSSIAASLAKEKAEAEKNNTGGDEKKDGLKTTVIISVIFAAVAGAAFGIAKKLRGNKPESEGMGNKTQRA